MWNIENKISPAVAQIPPVGELTDDASLSKGSMLSVVVHVSAEQREAALSLAGSTLPLETLLLYLNVRMPAAVMNEVVIGLALKDKDALVRAASAINLPHRMTREMMRNLSTSKDYGVSDSVSRLQALHCLLDIGVRPDDVIQNDRHCLGEIAVSWIHADQSTSTPPFSQPGAIGLVACAVNLLIAYHASVESPVSGPTGTASRADHVLREDEVLGPLLVWDKGLFLKGLLGSRAAAITSHSLRPRL